MAIYYFGKASKQALWTFKLMSDNNVLLLRSTERYTSRLACMIGIENVRRHAPFEKFYHKYTTEDGKNHFSLSAMSGETIARKEGHKHEGDQSIFEQCKTTAVYAFAKEVKSLCKVGRPVQQAAAQ